MPNKEKSSVVITKEAEKQKEYMVLDLSNFATPLAILLGAILIAGALYFALRDNKSEDTTLTTDTEVNGATSTPTATSNASTAEKLNSVAKELGLNADKFKSCQKDTKYSSEIAEDAAEISALSTTAKASGAGTPSFFICKTKSCTKGTLITGALPIEVFDAVIKEYQGKGRTASVYTEYAGYIFTISLGSTKISQNDPVRGKSSAGVTIYEYSDFECPYCQRHFTQVDTQLQSKYINKGTVRLVFKEFIAVSSHNPVATQEAVAAQCAGEQGKYWEYHDIIFKRTQTNGAGI